jgi:hypothetical protein
MEAATACRAYERLEARGHLDAMLSRYSTLRQYLPSFITLPFQAAAGSERLLQAIDILRALDAGTRGPLTADDPHGFVQADWRPYLIEGGKLDRHIWEISLALAVRDALRAGVPFLSQSRDHVSFWSLIHDDRSWQANAAQAYKALSLPADPQIFLAELSATFNAAARATADGLARNQFAAVRNGRLKLKRTDALSIPSELEQLRLTFQASYPRVRIEDLLQDVDELCGFSQAFQPLAGYQPRSRGNHHRSLLATLIAHGTNLGLAAMSQSVDTMEAETLQDTSRWILREETLRAANAILVDYHHRLPFTRIWGDGSRSSSDGQRFAVQRDSLLSSFYPRYFGYYDRALALYTHTSDQHSVYATQAISCAPREARYVLTGILENDSKLNIREHTSDTHGSTEHLFGLCALLGIAFMPRLKDLPDQVLSRIDRNADYGPLQPLLRGIIDLEIIIEQWDQLVRLVASLKDRMAGGCRHAASCQCAGRGSSGRRTQSARPPRQDHPHPALHPRRETPAGDSDAAQPRRVPPHPRQVDILCQSRRLPCRRLRGDHEQGQLPQSDLECRADLEHRAHEPHRRPASGRRQQHLRRGPRTRLPAGPCPHDPERQLLPVAAPPYRHRSRTCHGLIHGRPPACPHPMP